MIVRIYVPKIFTSFVAVEYPKPANQKESVSALQAISQM